MVGCTVNRSCFPNYSPIHSLTRLHVASLWLEFGKLSHYPAQFTSLMLLDSENCGLSREI